MMAEVEGNASQVHSLIEVSKKQGSPTKGPFSITTYVRVRAQTNVNGTANENSSSFENSHEIMRKVGKNSSIHIFRGQSRITCRCRYRNRLASQGPSPLSLAYPPPTLKSYRGSSLRTAKSTKRATLSGSFKAREHSVLTNSPMKIGNRRICFHYSQQPLLRGMLRKLIQTSLAAAKKKTPLIVPSKMGGGPTRSTRGSSRLSESTAKIGTRSINMSGRGRARRHDLMRRSTLIN